MRNVFAIGVIFYILLLISRYIVRLHHEPRLLAYLLNYISIKIAWNQEMVFKAQYSEYYSIPNMLCCHSGLNYS